MARRAADPASAPDTLSFEILVERPLPHVSYAMQRGKDELLLPERARDGALRFRFELRRGAPQADGSPRFLGEYAQGPVQDRFVYVCSGRRAGDAATLWDRRAKVKLASVPSAWVERALRAPRPLVRGRIAGVAKDGGPCCATVPLLDPGWELVEARRER
jgi:hypothetical protein